jgi:hypothetical protein
LVNEDLRRAFAFVANGDMGGVRSEVSRYGVAVFDEALPLRYDSWTAPRSWSATSGRASGWFPASSSWAGSSIAAW